MQTAFRTDDGRLFYVNVASDRVPQLERALRHSGEIQGMQVVELKRERLNPYVGSPVWSQWETVRVI